MSCTSASWGCWKCPIRAAQAPLWTGSANEKPAAPEVQPWTQKCEEVSWAEVIGVFPAHAAFEIERGKGYDSLPLGQMLQCDTV